MKNKKAIIMILSLIAIGVVIYFLFFYKKKPAVVTAPAESGFGSVVPGVPAWQLPKVMQKVKYEGEIKNTKAVCPPGSHPTTLADGSKGCIKNAA